MSTITSEPLILRHFIDRPTWAAAGGYDFNYLDCMAYTADFNRAFWMMLCSMCAEVPETEVRELAWVFLLIINTLILSVIWPFIFWIVAIAVWMKCKLVRNKYRGGTELPEIVERQIDEWKCDCAREWRVSR